MSWRKLIIATHRDVGYFFAGLTVIYAVSGIAVNHIEDWNPNYVIRTEAVTVGELPAFVASKACIPTVAPIAAALLG